MTTMTTMTTMTNTTNPDDAIVVIPAITVPADIPAKITDAITRLEEIAHETKALTRFIGVEIAPHIISITFMDMDYVGDDTREHVERVTGWEQLSDLLTNLSSEFEAAAGWQPEYVRPRWQRELAKSWEEAKEAFDRALLENVD